MRFVQLGQSAGRERDARVGVGPRQGRAASSATRSARPRPTSAPRATASSALHARDGRIRFDVETYELDDIAEAWERQASGSPGVKIVVEIA